jgi:catabolite repression protein CreC
VIPPPSTKYYPQLAESIPKPVMDTHNVVERLSEEEYQLVVGEGTYKLRESLLVATPPPHPSETPSQPPNPLDTARKPPTAGTTLSLALVGPRGAALAQHLKQQLLLQTRPATPNSDESPESSHDAGSQNEMKSNSRSSDYNGSNNREIVSDLDDSLLSPPVFGQDNPALISTPGPKDSKDGLKKRKPKNSMVKTNSSFVSRVHPLDGLTKKLSERDPDGIFALANINRSFHWIDLSAIQKNKVIALPRTSYEF